MYWKCKTFLWSVSGWSTSSAVWLGSVHLSWRSIGYKLGTGLLFRRSAIPKSQIRCRGNLIAWLCWTLIQRCSMGLWRLQTCENPFSVTYKIEGIQTGHWRWNPLTWYYEIKDGGWCLNFKRVKVITQPHILQFCWKLVGWCIVCLQSQPPTLHYNVSVKVNVNTVFRDVL